MSRADQLASVMEAMTACLDSLLGDDSMILTRGREDDEVVSLTILATGEVARELSGIMDNILPLISEEPSGRQLLDQEFEKIVSGFHESPGGN